MVGHTRKGSCQCVPHSKLAAPLPFAAAKNVTLTTYALGAVVNGGRRAVDLMPNNLP